MKNKTGIRIDAHPDETGRWQPVFEVDGVPYFVELTIEERRQLIALEEECCR